MALAVAVSPLASVIVTDTLCVVMEQLLERFLVTVGRLSSPLEMATPRTAKT